MHNSAGFPHCLYPRLFLSQRNLSYFILSFYTTLSAFALLSQLGAISGSRSDSPCPHRGPYSTSLHCHNPCITLPPKSLHPAVISPAAIAKGTSWDCKRSANVSPPNQPKEQISDSVVLSWLALLAASLCFLLPNNSGTALDCLSLCGPLLLPLCPMESEWARNLQCPLGDRLAFDDRLSQCAHTPKTQSGH